MLTLGSEQGKRVLYSKFIFIMKITVLNISFNLTVIVFLYDIYISLTFVSYGDRQQIPYRMMESFNNSHKLKLFRR